MEVPHYRPVTGAFTPVSVRRNFVRPEFPVSAASHMAPSPTGPPSAVDKAERAKRDWPPPVREYVQRAFAVENKSPQVAQQEMETRLKKVISEAAESNTIHIIDWANLPLPQQLITYERSMQNQIFANPPWGNSVTPLNLQNTNFKANETSSKKRKSSEIDQSQQSQEKVPPWQQAASNNIFEDRVSFSPDKRQRNDANGKGSSKSDHKLFNRRKRFDYDGHAPNVSKGPSPVPDIDQGPVVGRSQELFKKYFRLTSAPNPETVRPLPVLRKTLRELKNKWVAEKNYSYICDQFKSLRQDLTVQHIKNEFTIDVYQLHARIALEKGDLGEYNQCQTQLRALYAQNLGGNPVEFKAYRILYFIHTCNRTDMNDVLADLTPAEKKEPAIRHALDARSALALGNYHRFFQLYLAPPHMGAYLMDMFVGRERLVALSNLCIAYKPDVKLRFITEELGFESDDESARFVCDHGGQAFLDQKEDGDVRFLTGKAGRFFETAKQAAFQRVDIKGQI